MQDIIRLQQYFTEQLAKEDFSGTPKELYEPIEYILSLGGKRMRPALCLLGAHVVGDSNKAINAAMAVEVFHNFSLIHDDIMDEAPLRRGKTTVHHKWNTNIAILSGDAMLVKAYEYLSKTEPLGLTLKEFNKMALEVCEGQQMDMNFEDRNDVSIEEYLKMIEYKTAVLVGAALKIGALTAGAEENEAQNLYDFGRNLGIAFQLKDDWLDVFGDTELVGKQAGGDIIANKKTYLTLKAVELADANLLEELDTLYGNPEISNQEKVKEVSRIYIQTGADKKTLEATEVYYAKALESLQGSNLSAEHTSLLQTFAKNLMDREF